MRGRRNDGEIPAEPGDYGLFEGEWWCKPPRTGFPSGRLGNHTVVEHDDQTITVEPSILMNVGDGRRWHGYLRAGVWDELPDTVAERPT